MSSSHTGRLGRAQDLLREILASLGAVQSISGGVPAVPDGAGGMDFTGVVDLTPKQMPQFMKGVQKKTENRLRVFAEHGPVIDAKLLEITNYSHFQMCLTKHSYHHRQQELLPNHLGQVEV